MQLFYSCIAHEELQDFESSFSSVVLQKKQTAQIKLNTEQQFPLTFQRRQSCFEWWIEIAFNKTSAALLASVN